MQVLNYKTQYVENKTMLESQTCKNKKIKTNSNTTSMRNKIKEQPKYYRVSKKDAAAGRAADDDVDICTKPRNRCNQKKLLTSTKQTTNVNYKFTTQTNYNNNIRNNNSSNKLLNSIISILHCRQFKTKQQHSQQHQQQSQHYSTSSSPSLQKTPAVATMSPTTSSLQRKLLNHHYRFPVVSLDLIKLIYSTFLPYLLICLILQHCWLLEASCRDEPSRSCEAICRPIWSQDNYLSTMGMHPHNLTLEPFSANDYNCSIRALVLLPDDDMYLASLRRVVPILKVAVEQIHASGLLPAYIQFDWMPQDDKCDAAFATVKAMDGIVKNCAHVVFGPVCDYSLAAVGRIAKYFNSHGTPLITVGGSTFDFEKPKTKCTDEFYMLLRTGMLSFETLSELTINVMKRNNWSRSIFFYDRDGQRNVAGLHTCYLMMTSLGQQMRKENMTFAQYPLTSKLQNRTDEMIREIGNKHSGKC